METIEINLHFRKADFEEIYFRNGSEKLFFSPTAKNETYFCIAMGLLFFVFLGYFVVTKKSQELVLFFCIIWILSIIFLCVKIYALLKWKKTVNDFLDKNSNYKTNKVILSDNSLTTIQDNEEISQKWSHFNTVEINDESIRMQSDIYYLFPSKSMTNEDYELFKDIVREKIKKL